MKILKETTDLGAQSFICSECGTEFVAERGEYKQKRGKDYRTIKWRRGFFTTDTRVYEVTPCHTLEIDCPSCGEELEKLIPTGEASYTEEQRYL
jgi:predicted RNA-binding Zn-ribbon protein involved in translation (DUF1610 family)